MSTLQFLVMAAAGLVCLEAHVLLSDKLMNDYVLPIHDILPGSEVNIFSDKEFQMPYSRITYRFRTDADVLLTANCGFSFPRGNDAYAAFTSAGLTRRVQWSDDNAEFQSFAFESKEVMTIEFYSGENSDAHYECRLSSALPARNLKTEKSACECGKRAGNRIVGGSGVSEGEIPWQVGIILRNWREGGLICGGTLISEVHVLTAAHCPINRDDAIVVLGSLDREQQSPTAVVREISELTRHENDRKDSGEYNDIAVIKLASPVTFSASIRPACLPRSFQGETFVNKSLLISGWGRPSPFSPEALSLQKLKVQGVPSDLCRRPWMDNIAPNMLCASAPASGPCYQDDGGPLTYTEAGITYLAGVVSLVPYNCDTEPVTYTRVADYLDWIDSKTGGNSCSRY